jgi:hypothetical protein
MLHYLKMKVMLYISSSMTSEPLSPDVIPRELWLGTESRHPAIWHVIRAAAAGHLVSSHLQPPQLPGVPALSPQGGGRDHLSVLYITAPSVACCLSRSLISEKGDTVLFEGSSSWNLANVVGG